MKTVTAEIERILGERFKMPLYLCSIELDSNTTLRYAAARRHVTFPAGGERWTAKGFEFSGLQAKSAQRVQIAFNDGNQELAGYRSRLEFRGAWVELTLAFRDALTDSEDSIQLFRGQIEGTAVTPAMFQITAFRSGSLRQQSPRRTYGIRCPWKPGGIECNNGGLLDNESAPFKQSGTAELISELVLKDVSRSEAAGYWTHGTVEIDASGSVSTRKVTAFVLSNITIDSPPRGAQVGDTVEYTIRRGCDGSYNACLGNEDYGPSGDNSANYGGFLHLETEARNA